MYSMTFRLVFVRIHKSQATTETVSIPKRFQQLTGHLPTTTNRNSVTRNHLKEKNIKERKQTTPNEPARKDMSNLLYMGNAGCTSNSHALSHRRRSTGRHIKNEINSCHRQGTLEHGNRRGPMLKNLSRRERQRFSRYPYHMYSAASMEGPSMFLAFHQRQTLAVMVSPRPTAQCMAQWH